MTHSHCGVEQKPIPRFSDQSQPWWMMDTTEPLREASAPHCKRVNVPETTVSPPRTAPASVGSCPRVNAKSRKEVFRRGTSLMRWSEDNRWHPKRQFDALKPIPITKSDFCPLTTWSSFDTIRNWRGRDDARAVTAYNPPCEASGMSSTMPKSRKIFGEAPYLRQNKQTNEVIFPAQTEVQADLAGSVKEEKAESAPPPVRVETVTLDSSRGRDLSMMDRTRHMSRTVSRLGARPAQNSTYTPDPARVRSSGFQRMSKREST